MPYIGCTKIGIVGSRNYPDTDKVRQFIQSLPEDVTIITGGARGVDAVAEEEARKRGLKIIVHKPDFTKGYSPAAYHERNQKIAKECEILIAFWDNQSRGTASTIKYARRYKKRVIIK